MAEARLQELEGLAQELLRVLSSGWAEERLRRGLERRQDLELRLLDTQGRVGGVLESLGAAEAALAEGVLRGQAELGRCRRRVQDLQEKLERAQQAWASSQARSQELRQELQEVQEQLQGLLLEQQSHGEEDVPALLHLIHLYYKISRIDWDYEAEPGHVRGVHYGPDIAQPFELDTTRHSQIFISDFLWSLIPTEWEPKKPPTQGHPAPPQGAQHPPPGDNKPPQ